MGASPSVFQQKHLKKYQQLISKQKQPIFTMDFQKKVIAANKKAEHFFGKHFINSSVEKFVPEIQEKIEIESAKIMDFAIDNIRKNSFFETDFLWLDSKKRKMWSHVMSTIIKIGENEAIQCIYYPLSQPKLDANSLKEEIEIHQKETESNPQLIESLKKQIKQLKFKKKNLIQKDRSGSIISTLNSVKERLRSANIDMEKLSRDLEKTYQLIDFEKLQSNTKEFNTLLSNLKEEKEELRFEIEKLKANALFDQKTNSIQKMKERIQKQKQQNQDMKNQLENEENLVQFYSQDKSQIDEQNLDILNQKLSLKLSFLQKSLENQRKIEKMKELKQKIELEKESFQKLRQEHEELKLHHIPKERSFSIDSRTHDIEETTAWSDEDNLSISTNQSIDDFQAHQNLWDSVDDIAKSKFRSLLFIDFLCRQLKYEPFIFYKEICLYQEIQDPQIRKKTAEQIYHKHIKTDSLFEINLPLKRRKEIHQIIKKDTLDEKLFEPEKEQIRTFLNEKVLPDFKQSMFYEDIQNPTKSHLHSKIAHLSFEQQNQNILNLAIEFSGKPRHPQKVVESLTEFIIDMCHSRYSVSTEQIDLFSLSKSILFLRFILATTELQKIKLKSLLPEQKIPFFINLYNILIFHIAVLRLSPDTNILDEHIFDEYGYNIAGNFLTLQEIKHAILRNDKNSFPQLKKNDNKKYFSLTHFDPRIHFALLALHSQTPILRVFYSDTFDDELNSMTTNFLQTKMIFSTKTKKIVLPILFRNYSHDFGPTSKSMILWISSFIEKTDQLSEMISDFDSYEIRYVEPKKTPVLIFDLTYTSVDQTDSDHSDEKSPIQTN
ncbi:electron carrier/ protein disulfide oxidoreductase [Anaeramoeba ignava]|uniref:Electron carrier/ protein disulfide oxidoreductase n=1 Tax=Anaeramoeba ignava TaxID=1746090 RepID=A0A9Q0RJ81_ANAIG|nr:electron carrier/ protein disulfide oxidoreductase [Anaeramoeba ignava]